MSILASIYFLASILQSSAAASCWLPNGTEQNSTVTYVCPTDGASSIAMCCRSMDPSGDSGADRCIRAGDQPGQWLCQNDDGSVWRRGCSDQKWGSLGCLNLCAGQTNGMFHNYVPLGQLDSTSPHNSTTSFDRGFVALISGSSGILAHK